MEPLGHNELMPKYAVYILLAILNVKSPKEMKTMTAISNLVENISNFVVKI